MPYTEAKELGNLENPLKISSFKSLVLSVDKFKGPSTANDDLYVTKYYKKIRMIEIYNLRKKLHEIEKIASGSKWISGLDNRKKKEMEFHDLDRDESRIESMDKDAHEKFYGNRKYYIATEPARVYQDDWIEKYAKNKIFLDYACGNGSIAIKAAKAGAKLAIGIDISPISVENARGNALSA